MHTIPGALLWEILTRGRWSIVGFFLLGILMPMLVYTAMNRFVVDNADPAFLNMHLLFLPLIMVQFAVGIVTAQGSLARLYAAPISTPMLVAWHMFPGSILLASEVAIAIRAQNWLFGFNYPILGPSLFAAVAWAAAQVLVCVSQRTFSTFVVTASPIVVLLLWLHSRYGDWFSLPSHFWREVSITEWMTLISAAALSYFATVAAVGRDRCGEKLPSINGWKWLMQQVERRGQAAAPVLSSFNSAEAAQAWSEWRTKGIACPVIVGLILLLSALIVTIRITFVGGAIETFRSLHEGLLAGGGIFAIVAGVAGLMMGSTARMPSSRNHDLRIRDFAGHSELERMWHFLATRPISDTSYANVILRTALKSMLIAWAMWALALGTAFLIRSTLGDTIDNVIPRELGGWYFPLTLLGAWIAIANISSVMLTGRGSKFIFAGVTSVISLLLASAVLSSVVSESAQLIIGEVLMWAVSTAIIVGTALAIRKAAQLRLIERSMVSRMAAGWLAVVALALVTKPATVPAVGYALIAAFAALVVVPLTTAPLAVWWNRHG